MASVTLSPSPATVSSPLTCAWSGFSDADGDADASTAAWTVDGVAAGTGTTLSSGYARGDLVTCTVTPHDGLDAGAPVAASLTIDNAAPSVGTVSIGPDPATTNSTLTASAAGSDPDGDAVSFRYDWYVNGRYVASASTLSGATWFDKHDVVLVEATPTDGTDTGLALRSSSITVANSPPAAPALSIQPAGPVEGVDDLVCVVDTASTDADGDAVSYTMAWTVDGAPYAGTPFSYTWADDAVDGSGTIAGETWVCTATPDDGEDTGATATATTTIEAEAVAEIDYTGTWDLDTTVSYRCAGGLVDFSFDQVQIFDTAPDITVVGDGNVAAMTGTFSTDTDFDADNQLRGSCTETYAITGTFTSETTMTATISATYTGTGRSCADCTSRSWSVTGTR